MNKAEISNIRAGLYDWFPLLLIIIGLLFKWLHLSNGQLLANIGFILYGIVGLVDGINKRYFRRFSIELLYLAFPLIFILLATDCILTGNNFPAAFAVLAIVAQQARKGRLGKSLLKE